MKLLDQYFTVCDYVPGIETEILAMPDNWFFINYSPAQYAVPNTLLFTLIRSIRQPTANVLDGVCGKKLKDYLLTRGIVVSNGSACKIDNTSYGSVVLAQSGVPAKLQQGVIRVSFGDSTIRHELVSLVSAIVHYVRHVYST